MSEPETSPVLPRRFHLDRVTDETGISGTGTVAEGVVFTGGWVVLAWLTKHRSCAFYTSIDEIFTIHGHGGKTRVVFDDCKHCGHLIELHWRDNCGGCDGSSACKCTLMEHQDGAGP